MWPRDQWPGPYDLVLGLFDFMPVVATTELDRYDRGWWSGMLAGGFMIVPAGAATTPEFVTLPIEDTDAEFVTEIVWSEYAPPPTLPVLLDALDDVSEAHGWL